MAGREAIRDGGQRLGALGGWRSDVARSDLRANAKLVAFVLALFMSEEQPTCLPSMTELSSRTSLARSTVAVAVKELVAGGWLVKTTGGGVETNTYEPTAPLREPDGYPSESRTAPVREPEGVARATKSGKTLESKSKSKPTRPRERYPLFDALAEACGLRLDAMTKEAGRLCGIAAREIEAAGGTPEMMRAAVKAYRRRYEGAAATPKAIANHWPEIVPPATARSVPCPECGVGGGYHLADCSHAGRDGGGMAPSD